MTDELAPLETALLAAARGYAADRLKTAEVRAAALARDAEARARSVLATATDEGDRAGARAAAHRVVQARRQARALVLEAERAAYERLLAEAAAMARSLREQPEYRDLERRLVEAAKGALGPDAEIAANVDGQGGVQARHGARFVDLSLSTLARNCVVRLGQGVTRLWS